VAGRFWDREKIYWYNVEDDDVYLKKVRIEKEAQSILDMGKGE
jgi:hypothetical protein